jgi:threonine-phosphate decarboxylase
MIATHRVPLPTHGGQLRQIARQYGVAMEQLLDFSANINPAGPPPSVLSALQRSLATPATLATYPDLELTELKSVIASRAKVRHDNICVANGFAPLLEAALRSLRVERCLLPMPCFSEYRRTLENANVAVLPHFLAPKNGFQYEPDAIVQALRDHCCDAILLANPQNPSGALLEAEAMRKLIKASMHCNITVLLDEAFIDYCPSNSLTRETAEHSKLIVFRSVTKFFAIPGLRVAYAVGSSTVAKNLNRSLVPWPVTSFASDAVCAALEDDMYAKESRSENERRRAWLEESLGSLGIVTYRSCANFLLLRFPAEVDVRLLWERMVVEQWVVLRSCENFEGLAPGHLRVAVRSEPENERLIRGLEQVLTQTTE